MNNANNMWQLVARHLSKAETEEEKSKLKKIMEEDPCLQFSLEVLTHFWEDDNNKSAAKKLLDNHIQQIEQNESDVK
jgi:hypothetical protein